MIQEPWEIEWKDYYKILEIEKNASEKNIKKAYRKLAKYYHPDNNPNNHEAEEKFKEINEAYKVLSNKDKKKKYDQAWEYKKANPNINNNNQNSQNTTNEQNPNENINYEDIEKNYTAEEKRYAKRLALQHLIEEELEKAKIILQTKNELILSAYNEQYEKREYYNKVKEFISITNEYINGLIKLKEEAYKYDLLKEEDLINDTIEFLEKELIEMPLTPKEATHNIEKELYIEHIKEMTNDEISTSNEIIEKLNSIIYYVENHQITHIDYEEITNNILLEGENSLSKLKELLKLSKHFKLEEELKIFDQIKKLSVKIYTMPKTYEEAKRKSSYFVLINEMEELCNTSKLLSEKFNDEIFKLLKNDSLFSPNNKLREEFIKELTEVINEINIILQKKDKLKEHEEKSKEKKIEELLKLYEEATKLYNKADDIHKKADEIYNNRNVIQIENKYLVKMLIDSSLSTWDKNKAFEIFIEANKIYSKFNSINQDNTTLEKLCKELESRKSELERIIYTINEITKQKNNKTYGSRNSRDLMMELQRLKMELKDHIITKRVFTFMTLTGIYPINIIIENKKTTDLEDVLALLLLISSLVGITGLLAESMIFDKTSHLRKISYLEEQLRLKP